LWSFLSISIITGIINLAALALGASGLLGYIIGQPIDQFYMSIGLIVFCILLLLLGKYPLLDIAMKWMVVVLALCTSIAFIMSFSASIIPAPEFQSPDIFAKSGILFIIALMGWMPAPIEASVWTSLWSIGRRKQKSYIPTLRESLIDFHIGYIVTAVLAVFFLALGANVMHGSGLSFSNSGTEFSKQLIELYTSLFGKWSAVIIAPAAFITIFSSLLTVVDAYPRSITGAVFLLKRGVDSYIFAFNSVLTISMSIVSIIIVYYFSNNLKSMMDLATVISFLAAPFFAIINYKIVMATDFPDGYKPKRWLKYLALSGIAFLIIFSIIYLWSIIYL
jgi:Mn2+/Fe2+ NRAMP family transporter